MEWRGVRLANLWQTWAMIGLLYLCEFAGEARESQPASERASGEGEVTS